MKKKVKKIKPNFSLWLYVKVPGTKSLALSIISGESSPRPVFRWVENGKPRDANRTEVLRGAFKVRCFYITIEMIQ